MIKIDLITGFLGSGKTTFIRKYAKYLIDSGNKIAIVENDFGAINVDMMLLQDLLGENCELEMVVGGEDYDCHRRRFKTKLINLGMLGYDRVLVEPSGIYDVDEFFDVLHEYPLDQWYEVGNVLSIVDARLEKDLSEESNYLLVSQTANCGKVILSKTQLATPKEIQDTVDHLNHAMEQFQCKRRFDLKRDMITSDWKSWTKNDMEEILNAGYQMYDHVKLPLQEHNNYDTIFYMKESFPEDVLRDKIQKIMKDSSCGDVIRIKGFMKNADGSWYEANATRTKIDMHPVDQGQEVLIVIGEHLIKENINKYFGTDPLTAQKEE